MSYEIAIIPALAAIVYTLIDVTKTALGGDEKFKRFIPLIAMVLGAVCGVVAFYCVPGVMETENLLVAIILGASSGLSATGTNQVAKQLTKPKKEDTENEKVDRALPEPDDDSEPDQRYGYRPLFQHRTD